MIKGQSLIQIKKQQWAIERDEMKAYGGIWGNFGDGGSEQKHRPCIRSQFRPDQDQVQIRKRSSNLPPIQNTYDVTTPPDDMSREGDTSGYASDAAGNDGSSEIWKPGWPLLRRTPESGGSGREERAKWGEKGVGVGHLWSPAVALPNPPLLPVLEPATPGWLQRGLAEPQVLVIAHEESLPGSLATSQDMCRSLDTLVSSEDSRCFLRGNAPLLPEQMVEKERRRQKALEHQEAIRLQLEEKERKRKEEEERLAMEEKAEEERLRRHHELELSRIEEEKRRLKEKSEKEERVAKALREAIELAEKRAKEEKMKARRRHINVKKEEREDPVEIKTVQETETKPIEPKVDEVKSEQIECVNEEIQEKDVQSEVVQSEVVVSDSSQSVNQSVNQVEVNTAMTSPSPPKTPSCPSPLSVVIDAAELDVSRIAILPSPGRLLTPTKFRRSARRVEKSTQTVKSTRRQTRLEDRPQWGVNRPSIRYIKASDRDPFRRRKNDGDDSRSPSPLLNRSKYAKYLINRSYGTVSSSDSSRAESVTKAVGTPRTVHILPTPGILKRNSTRRHSNSKRESQILERSNFSALPPKMDLNELLAVKDVLSHLTALKLGLKMKMKEWDVTRSPTPFSEH